MINLKALDLTRSNAWNPWQCKTWSVMTSRHVDCQLRSAQRNCNKYWCCRPRPLHCVVGLTWLRLNNMCISSLRWPCSAWCWCQPPRPHRHRNWICRQDHLAQDQWTLNLRDWPLDDAINELTSLCVQTLKPCCIWTSPTSQVNEMTKLISSADGQMIAPFIHPFQTTVASACLCPHLWSNHPRATVYPLGSTVSWLHLIAWPTFLGVILADQFSSNVLWWKFTGSNSDVLSSNQAIKMELVHWQ